MTIYTLDNELSTFGIGKNEIMMYGKERKNF